MSKSTRRRIPVLLATASLLVLGLVSASAARSNGHAASWSWDASIPGAVTSDGRVRELARAGDFTLVAAAKDGEVVVGAEDAAAQSGSELQPLSAVASTAPLVAYTSATADAAAQALVGVVRSDVDRLTAVLADGTETDLPLNEWRAFSYVASSAEHAAVEVEAFSGGAAVGAVRIPQTTATSSSTTAAATPVYGVFRETLSPPRIRIARVDSRTLHRVPGASLFLRARYTGPMALSPDQQKLALVTWDDKTPKIWWLRIFDLAKMEVIAAYPLQGNLVRGLSWPENDRLLELRQTMGPPYNRNVRTREVWAVDPASGRRYGVAKLTNKLAIRQLTATKRGFVMLLGATGLQSRADSQLVAVDQDASARSVSVPLRSIKHARLGSSLAVDAAAEHAFIATTGGTVFDVDLTTMALTRHDVAPPAGPSAPAPIGILDAQMLTGKLVVAGMFLTSGGGVRQGVATVDTTTWSATMVDPKASRFAVLGDRLVTYGLEAPALGHGLGVFDADGDQITHLYPRRSFNDVLLAPGYGHVLYNGPRQIPIKPGLHSKRGAVYAFGPNNLLSFTLAAGTPTGNGVVSTHKPPLGPPILIFRGSGAVGEAGDRQLASAGAQPVRAPAVAVLAATTETSTTSLPQPYSIRNTGREVTQRGRSMFPDLKVKTKLYLLGTIDGRAFYRLQVTPHFRCYGAGDAGRIGEVGTMGCPTVVGAYPLQLEDAVVTMSAKQKTPPTYLRIDGLVTDGAAKVELRNSNGMAVASTDVANNLFAFPKPYPRGFFRIVPVDAQGNDLKPHPEWGEHQQPPPFMFGPRATRVSPSRQGAVVQRGSADGVDVGVDAKGIVSVHLGSLSSQAERAISGRRAGISCFVVSPTIRHTRSAGTSYTFGSNRGVAFKILGYIKPPFDGCEIVGSYGHRWRDQWGTHSPVEVALTPRAERYFENRATARDLALFVRSRTMHELRKLQGAALIAAIKRHYGNRVVIASSSTARETPHTVSVWTNGTKTIVSERSNANGRFYVQIEHGKIVDENVRGLAFVF